MDAMATDGATTSQQCPMLNRNGNPVWTKTLKDELVRLATVENLSAGEIAKRLGFETRNAIIGQLHRLGIKPTKQFITRTINPKEYAFRKRIKAHRPRIQLVEEAPPLPATPTADTKIPVSQRCTLIELQNSTCRWPVGEPTQPDFFFCGAATADLNAGKPYCRHHSNVSHRGSQ